MNKNIFSGILLLATIITIGACKKDQNEYEAFVAEPAAGACTVYDESGYAFTYRVNGLSAAETDQFFVGNSLFNQNWVMAPSSTTARDGLGPLFNAKACAACHFRDGRGTPVKNNGLLFRLGMPAAGGSIADIMYGHQLQDNANNPVSSEGNMVITWTEISGTYPDGKTYSLRVPNYSISGQSYGAVNGATRISPRVGQQMIGLGLLELIPESSILARRDDYDSDRDGVSGRPNYVTDVINGGYSLGRFGWKANVPSIAQQVAAAFNGDIGITSSLFPNENHTAGQTACNGLPNGGTPEISDQNLQSVITYSRTIAVPAQRTPGLVRKGELLFNKAQCSSCHTPRHKTGSGGTIAALKNVVIRPYTDLLLHDMGSGLADGVDDFEANGSEWRTPPLWGIGLIQTVNNHTFLLHDGRARSIEEAILWHGGEAEQSKMLFMSLTMTERNQLLKFLGTL